MGAGVFPQSLPCCTSFLERPDKSNTGYGAYSVETKGCVDCNLQQHPPSAAQFNTLALRHCKCEKRFFLPSAFQNFTPSSLTKRTARLIVYLGRLGFMSRLRTYCSVVRSYRWLVVWHRYKFFSPWQGVTAMTDQNDGLCADLCLVKWNGTHRKQFPLVWRVI